MALAVLLLRWPAMAFKGQQHQLNMGFLLHEFDVGIAQIRVRCYRAVRPSSHSRPSWQARHARLRRHPRGCEAGGGVVVNSGRAGGCSSGR